MRRPPPPYPAKTINRRCAIQAGAIGLGGLSLPQLWQHQAAAAKVNSTSGFGRAKRCIFLFMWGGPSQLDTFDMKPNAPSEIRGEFKPISTKTPGLAMCEHFHRLATMTDKVAIVRSLSHDDPAHLSSGHTTVTGHLPPVNKSDAEPPSENDTPHFGSVMTHLRPADLALPSFVMLPWKVLHPAAPGGVAPGQHGGWLGRQYNPFIVEGDPSQENWQAPSLGLSENVSLQRLESRRQLLASLDEKRKAMDSPIVDQASHLERRAFELLASGKVREAFDLDRESAQTRDRYGRNIHGQCVLLGRRLLERGVPIVNVNWHQDGRNFWDTHGNNFNRLKRDLIPPADMALTALLTDLEDRNMLDDTLVVWVGEFGRNPKISDRNAGREHWPYCYSGLFAGGGIQGGALFGESDKHAAYPHCEYRFASRFNGHGVSCLGNSRESDTTGLSAAPASALCGRAYSSSFRLARPFIANFFRIYGKTFDRLTKRRYLNYSTASGKRKDVDKYESKREKRVSLPRVT